MFRFAPRTLKPEGLVHRRSADKKLFIMAGPSELTALRWGQLVSGVDAVVMKASTRHELVTFQPDYFSTVISAMRLAAQPSLDFHPFSESGSPAFMLIWEHSKSLPTNFLLRMARSNSHYSCIGMPWLEVPFILPGQPHCGPFL